MIGQITRISFGGQLMGVSDGFSPGNYRLRGILAPTGGEFEVTVTIDLHRHWLLFRMAKNTARVMEMEPDIRASAA